MNTESSTAPTENIMSDIGKMLNSLNTLLGTTLLKLSADKTSLPLDAQAWTEQEVAAYLNKSISYSRKEIFSCPFFPPYYVVPTSPTDKSRVARYYKASEVVEYVFAADKSKCSYINQPGPIQRFQGVRT